MKWKEHLKNKWNIRTEKDFWMIMLTFSLAGMAIMPIRHVIFDLLGITSSTPLWIKICIYLPLIPPAYQIGLLFFGTILGQLPFFWEWEKNMLRRMRLIGTKNIKH